MKAKYFVFSLVLLGMSVLLFPYSVQAASYNWMPAAQTGNCDNVCKGVGETAVYAGTEGSKAGSTQLYVCGVDVHTYQRQREQYSSGFVPGKNIVANGMCSVPFNGKENVLKSFACLCIR